MIPWVRGMLAERRARWIANRKQTDSPNCELQEEPSASKASTPPEELTSGSGLALSTASRIFQNTTLDMNEGVFSPSCSSLLYDNKRTTSQSPKHTKKAPERNKSTVSSTNLICIRVLSEDGQQLNLVLPADLPVDRVKTECIFLFNHHSDNPTLYRLFATKNWTELRSDQTLDKTRVVHNDELYLVHTIELASPNLISPQRRNNLSFSVIEDRQADRPPTQSDIDLATSHMNRLDTVDLPIVNIEELVLQSDVQYDIRQILISLSEASAYIIGMGPNAQRLIDVLKMKLNGKDISDCDSYEELINMGFEEIAVEEALKLNNYKFAESLDGLISHSFSDTQVSNLREPSINYLKRNRISSLVSIVRIYCQKNIPVPNDMVRLIKNMGFAEPDVIEALKITKNNYSAACDWLIGNRRSKIKMCQRHKGMEKVSSSKSLDGLAADSPILRAMLSSPNVQISLSNPKMFLAYLSILEDYSSMSMWLNDSETSGTIGHILRTYHEEKHILAINEFVR